jgi:5'(3')-deoxyribonucleotidase
MKKLTLAIDFDGVLHDKAHPLEGKKMGAPMPGAQAAMDELYQAKHKIIIFTTMATTPGGKQAVEDWLDWYDFDYHEVTAIKPNADLFLDDRAVRFTDWTSAILELKSMGVEVAD